ncbi:MAG: fatty acid desaturase [Hahellaceae bacterium]|nr:fatty acid desaturase [Hahellaceae bacterium]MCP5168869.1 fatty acid desaturase [Hahellaceae bacterium]
MKALKSKKLKEKSRLRQKYPIPDRLNTLLSIVQISGSLALLMWASQSSHWLGVLFAALLFSYLMQMGFSLLHEAEHNKLHSQRLVNDGFGFLLAAMFPGSYQLMKVAHLNHHKVNRSDAELVDYIKPGENRFFKVTQYYALIHGLIWLSAPLVTLFICLVPGSFLKAFFSRAENSAVSRYLAFIQKVGATRVRIETLGTLAFWAIAISVLDLSLTGLIVCYLAFGFSWSSQQYVYHVRTPRHLIEGAYDLKLCKPLQALYLNFNYHRAHHRAASVPWIFMHQLYDEQPTRPYLRTYLALWLPPETIDQAHPVEFQAKGPLVPKSAINSPDSEQASHTSHLQTA